VAANAVHVSSPIGPLFPRVIRAAHPAFSAKKISTGGSICEVGELLAVTSTMVGKGPIIGAVVFGIDAARAVVLGDALAGIQGARWPCTLRDSH
jgi:hypothetical protein